MLNTIKKPIIIFTALLSYIVLQSIWWLRNTWNLYQEIYGGEVLKRKFYMLIGEGVVFLIILGLGFFVIYRAIKKEMALSSQQKNFLMAITHELKTPIASIKLLLQTISSRKLEQQQIQDLSKKAIDDADRLNQLVENILIATKIDERLYLLNKEEISLKELIENIIEKNKNGFLKSMDVILRYPEGTNALCINADVSGMISIVTNLLENASKYSEVGSEIKIDLAEENNSIVLSVSDAGEGIPDEEKENIFMKFYRIGNENTRKKKGTGLGLFIVKNLVLLHNGAIEVKNNSPKGTIFVLQFPKN
jgi:two-component system phosphate regulon sensor histidine kinase PhoR